MPEEPMVQVAVAGDVTEAEEIRAILTGAGIESELQAAEDDPLTVLVPESALENAKDAIEAMTEPDELVDDA
jgi:type III secretory pathway lipoprotein EscJ